MTHADRRPLGPFVPDWTAPVLPSDLTLTGEAVRLVPLDPQVHAEPLYEAYEGADWLWDYMPTGPFADFQAYRTTLQAQADDPETVFLVLTEPTSGDPLGVASYLRMSPGTGSIEVGNICIAPKGQRTRAFTEAMVLMMQWAFEAGYRRYEWKCNALNRPSRRAAQRLGFSYEGVFRQHMIVKGRNRDTAWFAVTNQEWPALRGAYDTWLDPANFAPDGTQRHRLSDLTVPIRVSSDPSF